MADFQELVGEVQTGLEEAQQQLVEQLVASITNAVQKQIEASSEAIQAQIQAAMGAYLQQVMGSISEQIQSQLGPALERQRLRDPREAGFSHRLGRLCRPGRGAGPHAVIGPLARPLVTRVTAGSL